MKKDIIILHGTEGSPTGNWFQSLKKYLDARGYNVYVPLLPTPDNQSVTNWHAALAAAVPVIKPDTTLVGHSCGTTFMLHVLEKLNHPIEKSIFVSGFIDNLENEEFDTLNKTFVEHDFNWDKIKQNAGEIHILHGDNDPYVSLPLARRLAEHLGTEITVIKNGGHLNAEFGFTEVFPELANCFK